MHPGCYLLPLCLGVLSASVAAAPPATPATPPTVRSPALRPLSGEALRQQAWARWEAGDRVQALALMDQAVAQFPVEAENYSARGQMRAEVGRYAEAVADLRQATARAPRDAAAWGNLGWYLILQGDFPGARGASTKARELAPDRFEWAFNLGHTYLLQGDRKTAHAWYERGLALLPDDAELRSGPLADFDLFIARGWQIEASRGERAWLEAGWQTRQRALLTTKLQKMGWDRVTGPARAWWQTLLVEHIAKPETLLKLLEALSQRRVTLEEFFQVHKESGAKSIADLLQALDTPGTRTVLKDARRLAEKGVTLYQKNQYADAEPLFREALAIARRALPAEHPDVATCLNNLAGVLYLMGRTSEAEPLFREALATRRKVLPARHPAIAESLNNLATLLVAAGRAGEAEPLYQAALGN